MRSDCIAGAVGTCPQETMRELDLDQAVRAMEPWRVSRFTLAMPLSHVLQA